LNGSRPEVQIVILINWEKVTAGVKGTVEVYVQGSSQPLQEVVKFTLNLKLKIVIDNIPRASWDTCTNNHCDSRRHFRGRQYFLAATRRTNGNWTFPCYASWQEKN
jgi:hypothetical protein